MTKDTKEGKEPEKAKDGNRDEEVPSVQRDPKDEAVKQLLSKDEEAKAETKEDTPRGMTRLERQTNRALTGSIPGAHAIRGPGARANDVDSSCLLSGSSTTTSSTTADNQRNRNEDDDSPRGPVLMATLVQDDDVSTFSASPSVPIIKACMPPLARAEPSWDESPDLEANLDSTQKISAQSSTKKRWLYLALILSLITISALTTALVFALRDNDDDDKDSKDDKPRRPPPRRNEVSGPFAERGINWDSSEADD